MITTASPVAPRHVIVRPTPYKRAFDLGVLVVAHVALLPIWLLAWAIIPLLIKLDDGGPVLFKQARYGKNGRVFWMYKFRTMTVDAEVTGPGWTSAADPRVTRVGGFLRRTALDEIPQLISIWKGDMSFLGPRALPTEMHDTALLKEPDFGLRLLVRPGLTGLSAVKLPRHCSPTMRLQCDLEYIENASFWLDMRIFFVSVWLTLTMSWGKKARSPQADTSERTMA